MVHAVLITGHAVCGVLALLLGCIVLRPPARSSSPLFRAYCAALLGLVLLLLGVFAWDWAGFGAAQRITFSLLCVLGVYTGWRALRASRELAARRRGWQSRYIDHVGFTLISLFDGFSIVAAIDLGAPLPVVVLVGAAGVAAGILAMRAAKARLHPEGPPREGADLLSVRRRP